MTCNLNRFMVPCKLLTAFFMLMLIVPVYSQTKDIQIQELPNGFEAAVRVGGSLFNVTSSESENRKFRAEVKDSSGRLIAASNYENSVVSVSIGGIALIFRTDKESLENGTFDELSNIDRQRLEAYLVSRESNDLRKVIMGLIAERSALQPRSLRGLLIISLVLGEVLENSARFIVSPQVKKPCRISSPRTILTSYAPQQEFVRTAFASTNERAACNASNCCGCCGVGCSGCTGCWTNACYLHDKCVDLYGHAACLWLLPAAVASIVNECMMLIE